MKKSLFSLKLSLLALVFLAASCGQGNISDQGAGDIRKGGTSEVSSHLTKEELQAAEKELDRAERELELAAKKRTTVSVAPATEPIVELDWIDLPPAEPLPDRKYKALEDEDAFYRYSDASALAKMKNGTVIRTRTLDWNMAGAAIENMAGSGIENIVDRLLRFEVVQILYRTTGGMGEPTTNVTSLFRARNDAKRCVISFQSAYDSLNPIDSPSWTIKRMSDPNYKYPKYTKKTAKQFMLEAEVPLFASILSLTGCHIVIPDVEGKNAAFAHGVVEGRATLDSIRALRYKKAPSRAWEWPRYLATINTSDVDLKIEGMVVVMVGYSGGGIATGWAAALADEYAPELLADRGILDRPTLVGASMGGLLIAPMRNLHYVTGAYGWGGVPFLAAVGMKRGSNANFKGIFTSQGEEKLDVFHHHNILALLSFPGINWTDYLTPQGKQGWNDYLAGKGTIGLGDLGELGDELNLALRPAPKIPIQLMQGSNAQKQLTYPDCVHTVPLGNPEFSYCAWDHPKPTDKSLYGDGVMLSADGRTLARQYCAANTKVEYMEPDTDHADTAKKWMFATVRFTLARLAGVEPKTNCGDIEPGSDLSPQYRTQRPLPLPLKK